MLRFLLLPFASLYNLVTRIRNYQYDTGFKPSVKFDIPVICVGNLTVGGTGKTPMVEHLIRLLHSRYRIATLSRGYGRKSTGFKIATQKDTSASIGDEPLQFFKKYGDKVMVTVGEDRAYVIPLILQENAETQLVLLDDAFQHRRVRPSFNILLTDYHRPFYNDYLLPAGRLREARSGAERADVVVVTKCPGVLSDDEMMDIEKQVRQYSAKPIFFSKLFYGNPLPFDTTNAMLEEKVILLTGIANPTPLKSYIKQNFKLAEHVDFNDHHTYSVNDLEKIMKLSRKHDKVSIITTEKDKVKLDTVEFRRYTEKLPLYYVPIEISFIKSGKDFDEIVSNHVKEGVH